MLHKSLTLGNNIWWLHEESESVVTIDIKRLEEIEYYENNPDDPDDRFARFGFNYVGIPLTETILTDSNLERFGNLSRCRWFKINGIELLFEDGILSIEGTDLKIQYVHELQNFYYLITKSNLYLKLT